MILVHNSGAFGMINQFLIAFGVFIPMSLGMGLNNETRGYWWEL
jgi:hypothetical protein